MHILNNQIILYLDKVKILNTLDKFFAKIKNI